MAAETERERVVMVPFASLLGRTIRAVRTHMGPVGAWQAPRDGPMTRLYFDLDDGKTILLTGGDKWNPDIWIEDICGDLQDLVGEPLRMAEERSDDNHADEPMDGGLAWQTWTFYRLATIKGYVTIRWLGVSPENGAYGERCCAFEFATQE